MMTLRRYRHPLSILAGVLVADLAARIGTGFDMDLVVDLEAALFPVAAVLLWRMAERADAAEARVRRLDLWLAACFALAGIRAVLWAFGFEVYVANLVILGLAVSSGTLVWYLRRRRGV